MEKYMDIKEFKDKGYLQEINRLFLHPLGLALAISIDDEDGEVTLHSILDCREDKEGVYYDIANSDVERKQKFLLNKVFIENELKLRSQLRKEALGFIIEPIGDDKASQS